jgi:hypothetical protein
MRTDISDLNNTSKSQIKIALFAISRPIQMFLLEHLIVQSYYIDVIAPEEINKIDWSSYDVAISEHGKEIEGYSICQSIFKFNSKLPFIFITSNPLTEELTLLHNHLFPQYIIYSGADDLGEWIVKTINSVLKPDITTINSLVKSDSSYLTLSINDSKHKDRLIQEFIEFFKSKNIRTRVLITIAEILDELITNALFNAPVAPKGQNIYRNTDRRWEVLLDKNESARVTCLLDNNNICISTKDPFGSLSIKTLYHHINKCNTKDKNQLDDKECSAGFGLYKIFRLASHFSVYVEPEKSTEFIITIHKDIEHMNKETTSLSVEIRG